MMRRSSAMGLVLVVSASLMAAACKDKSEVKPTADSAKAKTTATAANTAAQAASAKPPPAPKPKPAKPKFDPRKAIIGKWVGVGYTGVMPPGFDKKIVKKLRLVIQKEHVIQATPGIPPQKKRYSIKKIDGRKVTVEIQDVPGEASLEVRADGLLYLTDPTVKATLIYRRGEFDSKSIEEQLAKGTPAAWQPSAADLEFKYLDPSEIEASWNDMDEADVAHFACDPSDDAGCPPDWKCVQHRNNKPPSCEPGPGLTGPPAGVTGDPCQPGQGDCAVGYTCNFDSSKCEKMKAAKPGAAAGTIPEDGACDPMSDTPQCAPGLFCYPSMKICSPAPQAWSAPEAADEEDEPPEYEEPPEEYDDE